MFSVFTFWRDCRPGRVVHLCFTSGTCATGRVERRSLRSVTLVDAHGARLKFRWSTMLAAQHDGEWEELFSEGERHIADARKARTAIKRATAPVPITEAEIEALEAQARQP